MQGATEPQQPNSSLPDCWGREGGRYERKQLEEEMVACNTDGVFCMTVPSELNFRILMDQPLPWFSGMVTVLETLDSQKFHKEISLQPFSCET